jgi:hypothetical protein
MAPTSETSKGFFAALFDFSFTTFITMKFLKIIYGIVMVAIGLSALFLFFGMATEGGAGAVAGLVITPIFAIVSLILARVQLEALALFFRIGDNTQAIRQGFSGPQGPVGPPPGGPAPGAGPFGSYPPPNQGGGGGFPPPGPPQGPPPGYPPQG